MNDDFYRAFEDRYRGSRELIKSRLRVYLAFVMPLKALYEDCVAVDLGCGRGEWLELMDEVGIDARGVDLDEGMLAACVERGLTAEQREALAYLRALPDASVAVVSGFHVAEHIPFEALQQLVQQALRVLRPAGLLILETPNPENVHVGSSSFYLDPTHQRPIPPSLLSFLPEHYGFTRAKVVRLQERPGLMDADGVGLSEVLLGVSPDYSVVAQKGSETPADLARFDEVFATEFGVDLDTLATKYDTRIGAKLTAILAHAERSAEVDAWAREELAARGAEIERLHGHIAWQLREWEQAREELASRGRELTARNAEIERLHGHIAWQQGEWEQAKARTSELEERLQALSGELHAVHQSNHHHWMLAEAKQQQINDMLSSTSFRVTAPMRAVAKRLRALARVPSRAMLRATTWLRPRVVSFLTNPGVRGSVAKAARWTLAQPRLARPIKAFVGRYPGLNRRLRWLLLGQVAPAVQPQPVRVPDGGSAANGTSGRVRQPLRGTAADIDELMLRIQDELGSLARRRLRLVFVGSRVHWNRAGREMAGSTECQGKRDRRGGRRRRYRRDRRSRTILSGASEGAGRPGLCRRSDQCPD